MDTKKLLGKRLKELIAKSGYSQEQLSKLVDIEPSSLSNIIRGRNYPLFAILEKILKVLNVSFVDAFSFEQHVTYENLENNIAKMLKSYTERIKDFYKIAKALTD